MSDLGSIAATVKAADYDRYLAALFAPEPQRGDLLTLYAFNHEIAKIGESVRERMLGEIRLAWWDETIDAIGPASQESRGPIKDLALIVNRHSLPKDLLRNLVAARREHDLASEPMQTWKEFDDYADRTAGTVVRLAARILGAGALADEAAVSAGRAWALTGHMRNLSVSLARHKLFLPAELFAAHGLDVDDIFHAKDREKLRPAVEEAGVHAFNHLMSLRRAWSGAARAVFPAFAYLSLAELYLTRMTGPAHNPAAAPPDLSAYRRAARLLLSSLRRRI
jgi:phytoene synthase